MDKCIAGEQEKLTESRDQIRQLKDHLVEVQQTILKKDREMYVIFLLNSIYRLDLRKRDEGFDSEKAVIEQRAQDLDRQLTQIKAKEYDKVDFIKANAELEARVSFLTAEKEILTKERNRVEIENNRIKREKSQLQG